MQTINVVDRKGTTLPLAIELGEKNLLYASTSGNTKTGNIPSQWVGASTSESEETCTPCPLWQSRVCYAQHGTPKMGQASLFRGAAKGNVRTLESALKGRSKDARYVRMGTIGDPGSITKDVYEAHETTIRAAGLGALSYTHQWYLPHAEHLKGHALASADTMEDVAEATEAGWRVAYHVDRDAELFNGMSIEDAPQGKLGDKKYFLCPAQREGSSVTCNTCGLCDGQKKTNVDVVVFIEHGRALKHAKKVGRVA